MGIAHQVVKRKVLSNQELKAYIRKWCHDHSTPSSNTREVVRISENGVTYDHVIHWRTDTITNLYTRCNLDAQRELHQTFSRAFFFTSMPSYIRLKRQQDGLCPLHHVARAMQRELERKRASWHRNCTCTCVFCSTTGCAHGKQPAGGKCSDMSCTRCQEVECPREFNAMESDWLRPVQQKRTGGGIYWVTEQEHATREQLMANMRQEMAEFHIHDNHVIFHKTQMRELLQTFAHDEIIVKADFIQNIVHSRGRETSQSYYGKRQSQFLVFVVWYRAADNTVIKLHVDYVSSYLKHNSLFFQKCLLHLLDHIQNNVGANFSKVSNYICDVHSHDLFLIFLQVWIDTDGGRAHFKSRISFFFASTIPDAFGIFHLFMYLIY